MNLLTDIKSLITGIESNIYLNDKPDLPNNVAVIYLTGGEQSNFLLDNSLQIETRDFQVIIRDTSTNNAISRCEAIKNILDGVFNQTINSTKYLSIIKTTDILTLGKDDKKRIELAINFQANISN